jgi:hypothetical protein
MNFMKIRRAVLNLITCRQAGMMELRGILEFLVQMTKKKYDG